MRKRGINTAAFGALFVGLFGLTFGFLVLVDAVPNTPSTTTDDIPQQQTPVVNDPTAAGELPVRLAAKDIGLTQTISNPNSTDIDVLDKELLKGGVRYPTSALLGSEGTVLIFGHSSYLPIVHNQAYKAFDGIQNLKTGETVSVYSAGYEYRYAVRGVRVANATEDVNLLAETTGQHLVLVTCDSFGTHSDRFVVTADFVGKYTL